MQSMNGQQPEGRVNDFTVAGQNSARAGLISMTPTSRIHVTPLPLGGVCLSEGFWKRWCQVNRDTTIPLGPKRLEEAGNFYDLRLAAGQVQGSYKGPVYQDSDVYKWSEAVAWERGREDAPDLAKLQAKATELITAAQAPDGYVNSYWDTHPELGRFSDLAHGHELYCAGHLIQAAVAQYRATGEGGLLKVAIRFADYLVAVFGADRREGVPGHPEIEMALVELYRLTGNDQYLNLAKYFVDARGRGLIIENRFGLAYYQDRIPVRNATSLEGHAVRALYFAAGATDVAIETGDEALLQALERQWADMVATKTYITGGMGARWEGEAFGEAYELPNDRAYCETCAAIGSILWSWRLLLATGDGRYADLIERTLFNAMVSGLSLDGERFFYVNPLQLRKGDDEMSSRSPGRGRQAWYGTACCPTNVMRFLASVEQYFCTQSSQGVQLQQFASGVIFLAREGAPVELRVATDYPWDGKVEIEVLSSPAAPWVLSIRIPGWCRSPQVTVNGEVQDGDVTGSRYAEIKRAWMTGDRVSVEMPMPARRTRAVRALESAYGSVALERGPLVYCIEQRDCPEGTEIECIRLDEREEEAAGAESLLGGVVTLKVPVVFAANPGSAVPYAEEIAPESYGPSTRVTAVPYYAWANRGVGPMRVWIPRIEQA
jgi:DUF1680 family protein